MKYFKEIIAKQRDGLEISDQEIEDFVKGVVSGDVTDAQVGAYTMAAFLRGMTGDETVVLTKSMAQSGTVLSWDDLDGPVVDKHSTGGVGDLTSLVLAPMLAACGAYVPMISGRELEHTGGTLNKLEAIPGYNTSPDVETFRKVVKDVGCAIAGQTSDLNPADKRMYAARNAVSTVEAESLIVSSIISKKLAAGIPNLVLDVKEGSGAFMTSYNEAKHLALKLVNVGKACGLKVVACITDMNQPLAYSVGNGLEVREAIEFLTGQRSNPRLAEVVSKLGSEAMVMAGAARDVMKAEMDLMATIDSGAAAEKFAKMVAALGGPTDLLDNPDKYLPDAKVIRPVYAERRGHVHTIDTKAYGQVLKILGGSCNTKGGVDNSVGLSDITPISCDVSNEKPLLTLHAQTEEQWAQAAEQVRRAAHVEIMPISGAQPVLDTIKSF